MARNNPRAFETAEIDFPYDFDRDRQCNATDVLLARNNQTSFLNELQLIDLLGTEEEGQAAPLTKLAWLYDYDQAAAHQGTPEKDDSATAGVDAVVSMLDE